MAHTRENGLVLSEMFKKCESIEKKFQRMETLENVDVDEKYKLSINNEDDFQAYNTALLDSEI